MLRRTLQFIGRVICRDLSWREKCVKLALREQELTELYRKLETIVDDEKLKHQYPYIGYAAFDKSYYVSKIRAQHSFQISMVKKALRLFDRPKNGMTIVDIGDSAGTHILYLRELLGEIKSLSVNLDPQSVELIKSRGLEAIQCRAEELEQHNIKADLFLSFQMLEHLSDPVHFLKNLADKSSGDYLVITVPYLAESRVALRYIRDELREKRQAGHVHVFELDPEDWKLLFRFAGWEVVAEKIYYQYPRAWYGRWLKHYWRVSDFEGFYGVVLRKNRGWSELYLDW